MAIRYLSGINVDSNTLFVDDANNRVGIGTTNPLQKLQVDGSIYSNGGNLYVNGGKALIAVGDLAFQTNNGTSYAEVMRMTGAGNVGIGTTSPNNKLTVSGDGGGSAISYFNNTNSAGYGILINTPDTNNNRYALRVNTGAGTALFVGNGGNVGIGTASPGYKLDVRSSLATIAMFDGTYAGIQGIQVQRNGGDNVRLTANYSGYGGGLESSDALRFSVNGADISNPSMYIETTGNVGIGTTSPVTKLEVDGTVTISGPSAVKWKYSDNYAYFGIGYISGADYGFYNYNYGRADLYIQQSTGNVGIGTTTLQNSSGYKTLSISGSTGGQIAFQTAGTGKHYIFSSATDFNIYNSTAGNLILYTNAAERMRITSDGNVGIGTTSPGNKLHVVGSATVSTSILVPGASTANALMHRFGTGGGSGSYTTLDVIKTADTSGDFVFMAYAAGVAASTSSPKLIFGHYDATPSNGAVMTIDTSNERVGIGTTSPSERLHVSGNLRVTGAYYDSSNSAGSSGQVLSSTATGTDWVSLSEISGVDGTGTANYVAKWSDADTITDSVIYDDGTNVGIGVIPKTGGSTWQHIQFGGTGNIIGRISDSTVDAMFANNYYVNSSNVDSHIITGAATRMFLNDGEIRFDTAPSAAADAAATFTNRLFIANTGNVGIGTTSPAAKLEIRNSESGDGVGGATLRLTRSDITSVAGDPVGTIEFYSTDADTPKVTAYIKSMSEELYGRKGSLAFGVSQAINTDATEAMRISDSGNVGIGTASPDAPLTVTNNAVSSYIINVNMADDVDGGGFYEATGGMELYLKDTSGTGQVKLTSSGPSYLNGGNVGIGTTSPSHTLDVNGELRVGTVVPQTSADFSVRRNGANIEFGHGNRTSGYYGTIGVQGNNGMPYIAFSADCESSVNTFTTRGFKGNVIHTDSAGNFMFSQLTTANSTGQSLTERMRLGSDGSLSFFITSDTSFPSASIKHNSNNYVYFSGGSNGALFGNSNQQVRLQVNATDMEFLTGGNTKAIIASNGNVGIGTTSPATKLHIAGSSSDTAGTGLLRIEGGGGGGNVSWTFRSTVTNNDLTLDRQYAGAYYQALTFQRSTGNVGIGTTNPTTPLHVYGIAQIVESGNTAFYGGNYVRMFGDQSYSFRNTGGSIRGIINTTSGNFSLYNSSSVLVNQIATAGNSYFNGGNVGIGTTSPGAKLTLSTPNAYDGTILQLQSRDEPTAYNLKINEVVTAGVVQWSFDMTNSSAYNNVLVFDRGNVGIGITSPSFKLQVNGDFAAEDNIYLTDAGTVRGKFELNASDRDDLDIKAVSLSSNMKFFTENAEKMRITAAGNVGIGTTSPGYKLDVNGESRVQGQFRITGNNVVSGYTDITGVIYHRNDFSSLNKAGTGWVGWAIRDTSGSETVTNLQNIGTFSASGAVTLSNYGAGYLKSDASGNITVDADIIEDTLDSVTDRGNTTTNGISVGNLTINSSSSAASYIYLLSSPTGESELRMGDTDTDAGSIAYNNANNFMAFRTNAAERVRITALGNVGIGTTSPESTSQLHIYKGTAAAKITLETTDSYESLLNFSAATNEYSVGFNKSDNTFRIANANSLSSNVRMVINNDGNVGIGTNSPGQKLHVVGDARIEGNLTINGTVTQIDTDTLTTEQWLVTNDGTGPAVVINQKGSQPVIDIQDDGTSVMYIEDGGNVGIGTTNPQALLHLNAGPDDGLLLGNGNAILGNTGSGYTEIIYFGSGSVYYGRNTTGVPGGTGGTIDNHFFRTNGATRLAVAQDGNVGIGTISPAQKLHIVGGHILIENNYDLRAKDTAGTERTIVRINSSNEVEYGWSGAGPVKFMGGGSYTERMRIHTNGNVGIGTTSPAAKLDVSTTGTVQTAILGRGSDTNFRLISRQDVTANTSGAVIGEFGLDHTTTRNAAIRFHRGGSSTGGFITLTANDGTERVRIASDGNVGIGTTSPGAKLDVNGVSRISGTYATTGQDPLLEFYNTDTSLGANQILGTIDFYQSDTSGGGAGVVSRIRSINDSTFKGEASLTFHTGEANVSFQERMRITSAGNVGIGTTSPSYKLDVDGTGRFRGNVDIYKTSPKLTVEASDANQASIDVKNTSLYARWILDADDLFRVYNQTSSFDAFAIKSSGNVGIGTAAPSQKLHVDGNLRVTGAYYDSNNSAGTSGQILKSTGTGTDWVTLSEITGVDGTGTANYIAKWSDTDTIANSQIQDNGTTVGIGQAPGDAKLSVAGNSIKAGGKLAYTHNESSLDTTGVAVAGLTTGGNGVSALFTFTMYGGQRHYQKVVYSCQNAAGTWYVDKVIDEGTNGLDVVASADSGSTITFTFKASSSTQYYSPAVHVECLGASINTTYL